MIAGKGFQQQTSTLVGRGGWQRGGFQGVELDSITIKWGPK